MNLLLYCFSGTGNTLRTAKRYCQAFAQYELHLLPTVPPKEIGEGTLLGIGFPIHAFRTPEIVVKFIKTLPMANNVPCFIFMTSGEGLSLNRGAPTLAVRFLTQRGYEVVSIAQYLMPYNMVYRHSDSLAKLMDLTMELRVSEHAQKLQDGLVEDINIPWYNRMFSSLFRIEWWYARHPGFHVDMKACIGCGKCITNCPTHNIFLDNGKIQFSNHCTLCVGCSFHCPNKAIHLGLLQAMRVNGSYHLDELANDPAINPAWDDGTRLSRMLYKRYFTE